MTSNQSPLKQALHQPEKTPDEAREDGIPLSTAAAPNVAKRLWPKLHQAAPRRYAVYPGGGGGVCIDAQNLRKNTAVIRSRPDGSIRCTPNIDDRPSRSHHSNDDGLPDERMTGTLLKIAADQTR